MCKVNIEIGAPFRVRGAGNNTFRRPPDWRHLWVAGRAGVVGSVGRRAVFEEGSLLRSKTKR